MRYTTQHEWIAVHQDKTAFVGITKYATDALGDATYVELPEVGTEIAQGEMCIRDRHGYGDGSGTWFRFQIR